MSTVTFKIGPQEERENSFSGYWLWSNENTVFLILPIKIFVQPFGNEMVFLQLFFTVLAVLHTGLSTNWQFFHFFSTKLLFYNFFSPFWQFFHFFSTKWLFYNFFSLFWQFYIQNFHPYGFSPLQFFNHLAVLHLRLSPFWNFSILNFPQKLFQLNGFSPTFFRRFGSSTF